MTCRQSLAMHLGICSRGSLHLWGLTFANLALAPLKNVGQRALHLPLFPSLEKECTGCGAVLVSQHKGWCFLVLSCQAGPGTKGCFTLDGACCAPSTKSHEILQHVPSTWEQPRLHVQHLGSMCTASTLCTLPRLRITALTPFAPPCFWCCRSWLWTLRLLPTRTCWQVCPMTALSSCGHQRAWKRGAWGMAQRIWSCDLDLGKKINWLSCRTFKLHSLTFTRCMTLPYPAWMDSSRKLLWACDTWLHFRWL